MAPSRVEEARQTNEPLSEHQKLRHSLVQDMGTHTNPSPTRSCIWLAYFIPGERTMDSRQWYVMASTIVSLILYNSLKSFLYAC